MSLLFSYYPLLLIYVGNRDVHREKSEQIRGLWRPSVRATGSWVSFFCDISSQGDLHWSKGIWQTNTWLWPTATKKVLASLWPVHHLIPSLGRDGIKLVKSGENIFVYKQIAQLQKLSVQWDWGLKPWSIWSKHDKKCKRDSFTLPFRKRGSLEAFLKLPANLSLN